MKPSSTIGPVPSSAAGSLCAAQARFKEGLALHRQGQLAQAQEIYRQVLWLQPRHFEALYMLGMLMGQTGNSAQALEWIDKAIEINPNYASAHSNRGNVLNDLEQHQAAVASYDKAIAIKPDHADAFYNRGVALYKMQQHQAAIDSYDKAIAIKPDHAGAYNNRGLALYELKQYQAAVDSYFSAVAISPDNAESYYHCGNALSDLKQHQAAIDSYDKAIALKPDYVEAYDHRGIALNNLNRYRSAIDSFEQAISLKPDCAEAYANRGVSLLKLNQHASAIDDFDQAIAIKPDCAGAYSNRGAALHDLMQHQAAIANFDKAIAVKPDFAEAHWNLSLCYLQMADFERGWPRYEWRWKNEQLQLNKDWRDFPQTLWSGAQTLQNKTLLLYSEQGLGDTIQFCRYAKLLSNLGARVVLEVQRPLLGLLSHLDGVAEVISRGDILPAFDCHCPLLSLPLAFKTNLDSIPAAAHYLESDPNKREQWKKQFADKETPRVGLVWSGNKHHENDRNRSFPLSELVEFLPSNFEYVSLQKELSDADRATLKSHPEILHYEEEIADFTDTAALCSVLDLVISVDTSVAHLAGALGKPVWIVLPFNSDWRWLLGRSDSPWYPSARLFRQDALGDWEGVFERLAKKLSGYV